MPTIGSFGDSLKVFSYNNGNFELTGCHKYVSNTHSLRGGRINWSGNYLVCGIEESGVIPVLTNRNSFLSVLKRPVHRSASSAVFLNWTNRSLVLGDINGSVSIWDVKNGKTTVQFSTAEVNPVKMLCVNYDDVHIAAARSTELIRLYSCTTNRLVNTFKLETDEEFTDMKFSMCKRNYLGCSTMEGSVVTWDTNTGTRVVNIKQVFSSACSGIVFSPTNVNVMVVTSSQGLKVIDIRKKNIVLDAPMDRPLTCIDMLESEPIVITGSIDGYLMALDLRNLTTTVGEVLAHEQRVLSIQASAVRTGKQFNDAQISTPDESIPTVADVSFSDIISPVLSDYQPSPALLNSNCGKSRTLLELISTSNGRSFVHNRSDSILAMVQQSPSYHDTTEESPILSERSAQSLTNGVELDGEGDNASHHNSDITPIGNQVLGDVLNELKQMRAEIRELKAQQEEIIEQQNRDRDLMLDIHEMLVPTVAFAVRSHVMNDSI